MTSSVRLACKMTKRWLRCRCLKSSDDQLLQLQPYAFRPAAFNTPIDGFCKPIVSRLYSKISGQSNLAKAASSPLGKTGPMSYVSCVLKSLHSPPQTEPRSVQRDAQANITIIDGRPRHRIIDRNSSHLMHSMKPNYHYQLRLRGDVFSRVCQSPCMFVLYQLD